MSGADPWSARRADIEATELIERLNETWQRQRLDELGAFYHERAVLLPPDYGTPIVGRDAIAASYREFAEQAELHAFDTLELSEYRFERVTMVHLKFRVEYSLGEDRYSEEGLEVYTLDTAAEPPLIVWRHQNLLSTRTLPHA